MADQGQTDFLQMRCEDALHCETNSGLPFFEYLYTFWKPGNTPEAWIRYSYAGDFFSYGMALLAFQHPQAPSAFQYCEQWAKLCLEVADPEESIPQFKAYYFLAASAWLQRGEVPEECTNAMRPFALRGEALPDKHPLKRLAMFSFAHALAGDWEQAHRTIGNLRSVRPVALNTKGTMSPAQALTWAYQRLADGAPIDKTPVQYVGAVHKYLDGDGLLRDCIPWLYAYRAIFSPDVRPADLLYLLRPGAIPT